MISCHMTRSPSTSIRACEPQLRSLELRTTEKRLSRTYSRGHYTHTWLARKRIYISIVQITVNGKSPCRRIASSSVLQEVTRSQYDLVLVRTFNMAGSDATKQAKASKNAAKQTAVRSSALWCCHFTGEMKNGSVRPFFCCPMKILTNYIAKL